MQRGIGILMTALIACGGKKDDAPKKGAAEQLADEMVKQIDDKVGKQRDRKPTGTPRPQERLTVTLEGKPLVPATALAYRHWDGSLKVTVSTVPISCDDVTGTMRVMFPDEVTFDLSADDALQPDGSVRREVRSTYFEGMTQQSTSPATGEGDGSPGKPTTLAVDLETHAANKDARKLVVKGTIDALGCGAGKADAPTPPKEQDATIEIAGKKLAIRTALLEKTGDWPVLRLFTGGEGCKPVAFAPPSDLSVDLVWFKPEKIGQVTLGGRLIGQKMDQTFDPAKVRVTPAPPVAGEVALDIDATVSGYPVKVTGKVTAVACPK
ncbi:MAG: hypothetical protein KF773_35085 [Deltaproteobacteria bacterium]|nr:hypothetical protein [Deltaproteobacteria bacterium]